MAFTGPVTDRQEIRELIDTYSDTVIRQDLRGYLDCWTEDATRSGSGGECRGRAELENHWHGIFATVEQMTFLSQIASIAVDGDRAAVRSYCLEILALRDGSTHRLVGEYADDLVRIQGAWLFAHRHYRVRMPA